MSIPHKSVIICMLIINGIWLLTLWATSFYDEIISPKFISSSYDKEAKIEFNSIVLASLDEYIQWFYPSNDQTSKYMGDLPSGPKVNETSINNNNQHNDNTSSYINYLERNNTNAKFELIVDKDNNVLRILKIHINYSNKNGIMSSVSLYEIELDNFLIETKNEYDINKNKIKFKWETQFYGKIEKYTLSSNKNIIVLLYSIIINNTQTFRIRYFYLSTLSDNFRLKQNDEMIKEELLQTVSLSNENEIQFTFELYDSNSTYDDFPLKGTLPINEIDVIDNYIIYTRNTSPYLYMCVRLPNTMWQCNNIKNTSLFTSIPNKKAMTYLNYISGVKFVRSSPPNDINIFILSLIISSKGIFVNGDIVLLKPSNNSLDVYNIDSINSIIHTQLDKTDSNSYNNNNNEHSSMDYIYNMDIAIKKLTKFFQSSVLVSNNYNNNKLLFEFFYGTLCLLNQNASDFEIIDDSENKIDYISSDKKYEHILVKYKNSDMYYYYGSLKKIVSFNNMPKRYHSTMAMIGFAFEVFEERNKKCLFLLMENGVVLGMDFSEVVKELMEDIIEKFIKENIISIIIIILGNILVVGLCSKVGSTRRRRVIVYDNTRMNQIGNLMNQLHRINAEVAQQERMPQMNINQMGNVQQQQQQQQGQPVVDDNHPLDNEIH